MTTIQARVQVIPSVFNRHSDRIDYLPGLHAYLTKEPAGKSPSEQVSNEGPPRKRQRLSEPSPTPVQDEVRSTVVLASIEVHLQFAAIPTNELDETTLRDSQPVPIKLTSLDHDEETSVTILSISTSHLGTAPAQLQIMSVLEGTSIESSGIDTHLKRIIQLQKGATLTRLSSDQVAWAHCTLRMVDDGALLQADIHWAPELICSDSELSLLETYLPTNYTESSESWSPKDFYNNVYVPPADLKVPPSIQSDKMASQLYPFQKRAVHWLLEREGAMFENGKLVTRPSPESPGKQMPVSFHSIRDARGVECFISKLHRIVIQDPWSLLDYNHDILGGILSEEMGLGKTVELAALICLHERPLASSPRNAKGLANSPSTLIITPPHILSQWKSELVTHAPDLSIIHYTGMASASRAEKEQFTVDELLQYDVVLTTYNVLAKEIHFATDPPERSRRFKKQHKARKSPLVLINWWRVCLDEAQMVESGVSKAAKVAQMIPRVNAWAVSGTPIKRHVEDLLGLLIFLRLEPFYSSKQTWQRASKRDLQQLFSRLAIRHNKHSIAHELRIPRQRRSVIVMPFTAIEEQYYAEIFQEMCMHLHLKTNGDPESDEYDPETMADSMRAWLRQLRETCLHPVVGVRNRNALGSRRAPLRTVGEVLETMIEQNETQLRHEECEIVAARTIEAHIVANNKGNISRSRDALQLYTVALTEATGHVDDCRRELNLAHARYKSSKRDGIHRLESDDEGEEGGAQNVRLNVIKKQLHTALGLQQTCAFFVATSYYQIKENEALTAKDSDEYKRLEDLEQTFYDQAKAIRNEMLQENHMAASKAMQKLKRGTGLTFLPKIPTLEINGGIENRKLLEKMDHISELLDEQACWIEKWRSKIFDILTKPLVDQDEGVEITGDEYEDSTKVQDELPIYTLALRAMIADRHRLITGETNFLIEGDQKKPNEMRHQRSDGEVVKAIKLAKDGKGHDPKLTLELLNIRNKIKPKKDDESLKHLIADCRRMATNLQWATGQISVNRANIETSIIKKLLKDVQQISHGQEEALKDLKAGQEAFRNCMNLRVAYYKQVQVISDTVAPWRDELDEDLDKQALEKQAQRQEHTEEKLSTLRTKRRFLLHLRDDSNGEQDRMCVICRDTFENGVLTVCGHTYCKDCITFWFKTHRTCPECRARLKVTDFHDITYKPQEIMAREELNLSTWPKSQTESSTVAARPGSPSTTTSSAIYSDMKSETMREIKSIDLSSSYGTKIDTIARHLLWLRANDPGAKSIVFSQYSEFLSTLAVALTRFDIGHVSIRTAKGVDKFRKDPSKEVFLLDAKSDSSGLNLVNATHVFLCEPLINAAIELQAIARVHRIGQLRETRVYMYLISDTVEEAIYDMSVSRRLAHIGTTASHKMAETHASSPMEPRAVTRQATGDKNKVLERDLEEANNIEIQQAPLSKLLAKGKSGGEFVDGEDLWNCLFGKARTRKSYLASLAEEDREVIADAAEHRKDVERVRNAAIEERMALMETLNDAR
ncbi:ATP-dependent DNA helicase [Venturia nashicola]|nr:ATP-dependent DNA helicase [Venturia nashicola]